MMKIDVAHYVGAVSREVAGRQHEGKPARVVVATRTYDTTVEDLWDAVTNPERIPRWFLPVTGELKLGGRYQLQGNAGGVITGCEPPRRLAVTWEFGGGVTWLTVTLEADQAGGTRLQLEHVAHVDDATWDQYGPGAVGVGWDLTLIGLALHLSTGAAVNPGDFGEWSGSDEGKAFARASSAAWGRAAIASGDDEAVALARTERTSKAYTGEG